MKISITHKLFMALLAAACLAVISSVLIMQWSLTRGFLKFVNDMENESITRLATSLESSYHTSRSWDFLRNDTALWHRLVTASQPENSSPPDDHQTPSERHEENRPKSLPPHAMRQFDQRLFLLDADKNVIISRIKLPDNYTATPLRNNGTIIGYLGIQPRTGFPEAPHKRFIHEMTVALLLTACVIVVMSALLSFLLARRLVRPIRELGQATHRLSAGFFSARVPVQSNDELGRLAEDFNALALVLEKSEVTRRQWVADISHELRTPLAVLRGEIEALQDGIRLPDRDTIQSLHSEVLRLGRLVDDLYQLSMSDVGALTYRKAEMNCADILTQTVATYQPEFIAGRIRLEVTIQPDDNALVFGDQERIHQLFANLLDNSLKYTDAGGTLQVTLFPGTDSLVINFLDSAPGVKPEELDRLFERLYRVESSRSRTTGGAGLGLAICRNIVEAHNGTIRALPSPLGGVCIRIELPLSGR